LWCGRRRGRRKRSGESLINVTNRLYDELLIGRYRGVKGFGNGCLVALRDERVQIAPYEFL
jgi:hypothetical protein